MIETRIPCPVCLGVKMVKESPPHRRPLTLDLCPRCGGLWFEPGEIQQLLAGPEFPIGDSPRADPHFAKCHHCRASIDRNADRCPTCGAWNRIDCPNCPRAMRRAEQDGVALDVCDSCRGVWFDRHEVARLWTVAVTATAGRSESSAHALQTAPDGSLTILDLLTYSPDLGAVIVEGSVRATASSIDLIGALPELGGVVVESAGVVFEVLVQVVVAILEGLSG